MLELFLTLLYTEQDSNSFYSYYFLRTMLELFLILLYTEQDSNSFYSYYFLRTMLEFTLSSLLAAYMVFFGVREIQTDAVNVVFYTTSSLPRQIFFKKYFVRDFLFLTRQYAMHAFQCLFI